MYQFEPNPQSTVDAKGSDTLAVSILAVISRLFHRPRLIFLTKMPPYVSYTMKTLECINERKSPKRYTCKITFLSIWLFLL